MIERREEVHALYAAGNRPVGVAIITLRNVAGGVIVIDADPVRQIDQAA